MTCHAYMLTWVGLDLMHFLGWVTIHDTHHHMGVLRKFFVVGIFSVWIFGLLHIPVQVQEKVSRLGECRRNETNESKSAAIQNVL